MAYYRCTKALRYGFAAHGGRGQWPASRVEPPVQRWVLALLDDPDAALAKAQVYWEQQDTAWRERPERKRQLEAKLKALVVEEESAVTLQVKGHIDEDALEKQLARIRSERAATLGELLKCEEDATARARHLVDRAVVQGAIDLMRSSPTNPYADMLDDLMLATSTSAEDRGRWQADVRRVVQTAWLEQDGSVTVEGALPLDAATVSPRS